MTAQARDPGLQGERTAIAWNRTALAVLVNALLALRTALASGHPALWVLGGILAAAALATWLYSRVRHVQLAGPGRPQPVASGAVLALTAITWTACVAGLAATLLQH